MINVNAYRSERINITHRMPVEQKSVGVKNKITIKTDSESFILYFKLENEMHKHNLEGTLFSLIIENKLKNTNTIQSIKNIPDRFKNSEKYKCYVIEQIKNKKINCTEGLLLHGYSSDNEAKELREKYCY